MRAVFDRMSPQDQEIVVNFGRKVAKKARGIQKTTPGGIKKPPKPAPYGLTDGMVGPIEGLWDLFGLSTGVSEGQLLFFREAELKHGRVCMLVTLGFVVQ